jgi:hypothetical protein
LEKATISNAKKSSREPHRIFALPSGAFYFIETILLKEFIMKRFCVMIIAACVLAVSTASTAEAFLITKQIQGSRRSPTL